MGKGMNAQDWRGVRHGLYDAVADGITDSAVHDVVHGSAVGVEAVGLGAVVAVRLRRRECHADLLSRFT